MPGMLQAMGLQIQTQLSDLTECFKERVNTNALLKFILYTLNY